MTDKYDDKRTLVFRGLEPDGSEIYRCRELAKPVKREALDGGHVRYSIVSTRNDKTGRREEIRAMKRGKTMIVEPHPLCSGGYTEYTMDGGVARRQGGFVRSREEEDGQTNSNSYGGKQMEQEMD